MNNATQFNPSVRTLVTVAYRDPNLPLSRFIQLGFSTDSNIDLTIFQISWSRDNLNYYDFTPSNSIDGIVAGQGVRYSDIIDVGPPSGTLFSGFYLRYVIPAGLKEGTKIQSVFLANSNGTRSNGVLTDEIGNSFVSLTRLHTAIPEPTSIVLTLTATATLLCINLICRVRQ